MSTPLQDLVAAELAASGLDGTELNPSDVAYVENGIRSVLSGLKARRTWENHIGAILTHKQLKSANMLLGPQHDPFPQTDAKVLGLIV